MSIFRNTTMLIVFALAMALSVPANAQLFGPAATDNPQRAFDVGGSFNGNRQWDVDAGYSERIAGSFTFSRTAATLIPSVVTNPNGSTTIAIKPVITTGIEQGLLQIGRVTVLGAVQGGVALPSVNQNNTSLAIYEKFPVLVRFGKLDTSPGRGNSYLAITPSFIQIPASNNNTFQIGLNFVRSMNGGISSEPPGQQLVR